MMAKAIALDSNLLVLLVVGLTDEEYIFSHKRLKGYAKGDYRILTQLIAISAGVMVTPNVLAEASNLLRQTSEPMRSRISMRFRALIQKIAEVYVTSADACSRDEFLRLGLSDSATLEMAKDRLVILSSDAGLYLAALESGYQAENFNHYRNL